MKQKNFYKAFNLLYESAKEDINVYQKEEFYRLLFSDIYLLANDDLFDNDKIRKVTSGNTTIHRRIAKKLCTDKVFEMFRNNIAEVCIPHLTNQSQLMQEMLYLLDSDTSIPNNIKKQISQSIIITDEYSLSRVIAAILICLNHSDYIFNKDKHSFINIEFMRLNFTNPIPKYPRYLSDSPDAATENIIGREDELETLYSEVINGEGKLMVSAVGGLGKTELVKLFLNQIVNTDVETSGIETIAWIPYNNSDIRVSIKQSLNLQCEVSEVWQVLQDIVCKYNKKLLLVFDNIETVENDDYLRKLSLLQCRIIVTSRLKKLSGFGKIMYLQPLKIEECRNLFYAHYKFNERDNEVLNDIINLTARLTIMIVFIAKVAYLEELSLRKLYQKLVEKGFKLSDEDVSCEHEKLKDDNTIIRQMCILFSLVDYSSEDRKLLTYISIIPNLQFDFLKAKKWFNIKKNCSLMKLYNLGMLEHINKSKTHFYWMHSVIAASIREQQKNELYELSKPFISILSEQLDTGTTFGKEYEKAYLIPFSWSVADIMENHWHNEDDTDFLTNLFHICFACSNFALCEKLIDVIIDIQQDTTKFSYINLIYSYRNKIDLLLQFDRATEAAIVFDKAEKLFDMNKATDDERALLNNQYGILYQIRGDYGTSYSYFDKCIKLAESNQSETKEKDISTACCNMARMLVDSGDLFQAYDFIKRAIEVQSDDEEDSDLIICYSTLGAICTELIGIGYGTTYIQEAMDTFKKVIDFREKYLGKHHADTAVAYHDYAYLLYVVGLYDEALKYNKKAYTIDEELFSEYSITRMRSLNTKALILWDQAKEDEEKKNQFQEALNIFDYIIRESKKLSDDYLIDVADFTFNSARCLFEFGNSKKAKDAYTKCINIWSNMSEGGKRKLAEAHQEYADILFSEGEINTALDNYRKADEYINEDFYLKVDILDSIAACLLLSKKTSDGIQAFKELIDLLITFNATDSHTKFQLCNNLFCILDASSEDEIEWKNMLLKEIESNSKAVEYVNSFLINVS
mgnify:CR=1 FL=1